jgi:hypothetical protein
MNVGTIASDPAVITNSSGMVEVFWRGTDANLWQSWFTGAWNGPQQLGFGPLASAPVAVTQPGGAASVFWKGTDAAMWHAYWANGWHGPERLGGSIG